MASDSLIKVITPPTTGEPSYFLNEAGESPANDPSKDSSISEEKTVSPTNLDDDEASAIYPGKIKLTLIIFSLNLSLFCVGLDNTILSTAIPKITDQFHALSDVGWYASSYLLTLCAFQLTWGKLYTLFPAKWAYLISLAIFELGSLISGVASSSTTLIVGRAISGIGAGGVSTGNFMLIALSVPKRQRPVLVGMVGAMYGFASIAGPLMGGAFTDSARLTWRWCFYINLPLGFITAIFVLLCVDSKKTVEDKKSGSRVNLVEKLKLFDFPGLFCLLAGVICLLLALQWGGTKYEWKNGRIIGLMVVAIMLLAGFIGIQFCSGEQATVSPRVFSNRNIWGSALYGSCVTGCFFVMLYYIPIWFQAVKGASAITSGVMNIPMVISFVIASLLGGILTTITGHYVPLVYLAVILLSIGSGLLTTLSVDAGPAKWIGYQVIFGAGVGFGLQTSLTAPNSSLETKDISIGMATILFSENLIGAIAVSVAQNVFTNELVQNLSRSVGDIDPGVILRAGALQIKGLVPEELLGDVLVAYNGALMRTLHVCVGLACCSVLGAVWLEWLSVKPQVVVEGDAEA